MYIIEAKLYPKPEQMEKANEAFRIGQFVRNKCIAMWEEEGKKPLDERQKIGKYDFNRLTASNRLGKEFGFVNKLSAQARQAAAERAWSSVAKFYDNCKRGIKKKGYPKYRKGNRSVEYKQSGWSVSYDGKFIELTDKIGIGRMRMRTSESLTGKKISRVRLLTRADMLFAQFIVDETKSDPLMPTGRTIGIDVGIRHFYVDSNGDSIDSPKPLAKSMDKVRRMSRSSSRKKKSSSNRRNANVRKARLFLRLSRQRKDFAVKAARCVVRSNDLVAHEDLRIINMMGNHSLARSIADVAWGEFFTSLENYGKRFGRIIVKVDPRNTSQKCSSCGEMVPKSLSVRVHSCPACGISIDRDHNAAINILKAAISTAGHAGFQACGENDLCLVRSADQVSRLDEAGIV
ncbi:MAG: transposase [Dehalococcoidia bacterium]|jgi:putative transposase